MEEWLNIAGFDGYQISNTGKVKSLERKTSFKNGYRIVRERILKPIINTKGYQQVQLCRDGKIKHILVHRLVAEAFIPNPDNLTQVNHKDENPLNNNVENLEWCTAIYNLNYGTRTQRAVKSKSKPVRCIETNQIFHSTADVQRKLGFSQGNICDCCNGKRKSAYKYHWEYV